MEADTRVAYVVGTYPSTSETFIRTELRLVSARGIRPQVCALERGREANGGDECAAPDIVRPHAACCLGLSFLYGMEGTLRERVRQAAAAWFAEKLGGDPPSHVHAHFLGAPTEVGYALSAMLGVSFSFACHGGDVYTAGNPTAWEHAAVHGAQFVVACSEYMKRQLVSERGYPPAKVVRVYHGVDLAAIPQRDPGAAGRRGLVIGAVGRLVPKKGFDVLLRAAAPLVRERHAEVVIVGDGPERGRLMDLIVELRLGLAARLVGARPWRETLRTMSGFSVLAAPSVEAPDGDRDGLPNVLLEAGAMGVPVVASRIAAIPELVTDGVTGRLVEPGDVTALTDALVEIDEAPDAAAARADALREEVKSKWAAEQSAAWLAGEFATAAAHHVPATRVLPTGVTG